MDAASGPQDGTREDRLVHRHHRAAAGGLADSVQHGETGMLVGTHAEFVAEVAHLLDDAPLRQTLGTQAQQRAGTYSWAETGRKFTQFIDSLTRP